MTNPKAEFKSECEPSIMKNSGGRQQHHQLRVRSGDINDGHGQNNLLRNNTNWTIVLKKNCTG